jgi:hypothetical protein
MTPFLVVLGLPWFPWLTSRAHGGSVVHPLASLVILAGVLLLVDCTFRRKPS